MSSSQVSSYSWSPFCARTNNPFSISMSKFFTYISPGDDLCGLSLSVRFNSDLVTIWNRDGSNEKTKEGILAVVLEQISPELKPQAREYYYKKHSQHAGFSEVVARANEKKADDGKITEAEVRSPEGDEALLREAEGLDLKDLAGAGEI